MNFVSYADLARCIQDWLPSLPEVDVVVGVDRSGIIPATMIALHRNLPFITFNSWISGVNPACGPRGVAGYRDGRRALIVDDTVFRGGTMGMVRRQAEDKRPDWEAVYACVFYVDKPHYCDLAYAKVNQPRIFQWNALHHDPVIPNSCMDMDGVLCVAPTEEQNDDGQRYNLFLYHTKPIFLPTVKIGAIVTSRLEKYRSQTEEWLNRHGVKYDRLEMLDLPSKEERVRQGCHANWKAEVYRSGQYCLFVEDEPGQAKTIASKSGKPVLLVSNYDIAWKMISPTGRDDVSK